MPPDEPRRWRSFGGGALFLGRCPRLVCGRAFGPDQPTRDRAATVPESQRDCGFQPKVAELARLPWVTIRKAIQPQRGCGKGRARVKRSRHGRIRLAVGNDLRTVTQVARASQPVGFGPESRWDSPVDGAIEAITRQDRRAEVGADGTVKAKKLFSD